MIAVNKQMKQGCDRAKEHEFRPNYNLAHLF